MSSESVPNIVHQTNDKDKLSILPVKRSLHWEYLCSILIVLLTAAAAIIGLLYAEDFYPTEELRQLSLANDLLTLVLGLPIILVTMWLTRRGKLVGLLYWPGAVLYGLYNYFTYLYVMPFTMLLPLYLLIVTLSLYTMIGLLASIDGNVVRERLNGRIPEKFGGGVLIFFGILFVFRTLGEMGSAWAEQATIPRPELGLLITDFIFCFAWVIGGILLWRKRPLGYAVGPALLFQATMLFVGVIAIVLLQPVLTDGTFIRGDFIALTFMGLLCFIPFVLFVRGILKS